MITISKELFVKTWGDTIFGSRHYETLTVVANDFDVEIRHSTSVSAKTIKIPRKIWDTMISEVTQSAAAIAGGEVGKQ